MPSLRELLIQDLVSSIGEGRRVLLWLDPSRDWRRLWPQVSEALVAAGVGVLECDRETGSQLALKLALLSEPGDAKRTVVYLPGFATQDLQPRLDGSAPGLWSAYEYRFKGSLWALKSTDPGELLPPPTLAEFLEACGVAFADAGTRQRLAGGGADSMLALYAVDRLGAELFEWPLPLRESDVVSSLGGDPRESLRELIAAPRNTARAWRDVGLALEGITQRFGLQIPPADDPEEISDAFLVQLALTEAWDAFGRPGDFPFRTRIPASGVQREQAIRFLREDVLEGRELGSRYRDRMLRLEHDYDLTTWSEGHSGQPRGLPRLARNRFRAFLARFDEIARSDWKAAARLLLEERQSFEGAAATPWEGIEGDTHWSVLAETARLRELAVEAIERSQAMGSTELIDAYVTGWFMIDRLHLSIRSTCERAAGLERVRRVSDLAYFAYVEAVNRRLADSVADKWPPAMGVSELREKLWAAGGGRRAILVVDALRWDLGRELAERLQSRIAPVISTLPSTTPFGMSVLLPIFDDETEVHFEKGTSIRIAGGSDLSMRSGRKSLLQAELSSRRTKCGFLDLDALLQGAAIPDVPRIVVFDDTIDETGHKGTEEFPVLTEQLIGKLRRGIEKLHESGIDEVHVVTDHGFLLLPRDMVDGLGRPEVKANQVLRRELRWAALKPDAPVTGLVRFQLPLGKQEIDLGFPRGVRTLMVPKEDFMHGGISLQECVIPHVVSRVALGPVRTQVEFAVATPELTTGTVPLAIRPFAESGTLGSPIPIRVRVWVESADVEVTDPLELEARADTDELKPPLYLREGLGLSAGTQLTLRAVDSETGRELATIPLKLKVDWE